MNWENIEEPTLWENYREQREITRNTIQKQSFFSSPLNNVNQEIDDEESYPYKIIKTADKTSSGIPKILWRTYKHTNLPGQWKEGFESGSLLKGWKLIFMTDEDNELFIRRYYPSLHPLYNNFEYNIQKVDLVRILYLYKFGGLYADLDKIFLTDFSHFFEKDADVFLVRSPNIHSTYTNSFMASKPGVNIWKEMIEEIAKNNLPMYAWGKHLKVMNSTGPSMLTYIARNTNSVVSLLPGKFFESCSVCDYPCKASAENGQYVRQIEGSSWIGMDTQVYLCLLCSWPQTILLVLLVVVILYFFVIKI